MNIKLNHENFGAVLKFLLLSVAGSMMYALGVNIFIAPHNIAPGGVTGIATMLNFKAGIPIGLSTLTMNIPLLLLAGKYISKEFTIKNTFTIILFSFCTDLTASLVPAYTGNTLLSCMFGGAMIGIGNGIIHTSGSSTGGTTIMGILIKQRHSQLSIGKMTSFLNMIVVMVSIVVFGNIDSAMYALISIFVTGKFMDTIAYGGNTNKLMFIISDQSETIRAKIFEDLHRGITIFDAYGGYKNTEKNVLMCVVSKGEFMKARKIIEKLDEKAFIVAVDSGDVLGKGFTHID